MKKTILSMLVLAMMPAFSWAQQVPQDNAVKSGKLSNGLTYYIRHNAKEKGLADFYIAQRVGAILEEPRQRGLSHFLEHMAFNDSLHLGIVPWCETIGVKFGANLNAYTSIDETVYNISSVPVSRDGIIDSCLLILHDWSHYLLLTDKEIDKERGVIHEEWRTRRAGMAMQRLTERALPEVFRGTKYEDCMPIGSMDVVDNFPYQDLRDYYQKWYRPDLQAIIVVGDIDVDAIERKIVTTFGQIPLPVNRAERIYYPVSDNDKMIVTIQQDKEQPITLAQIYMKCDATPDAEKLKEQYLRDNFLSWVVSYSLNNRLEELQHQTTPPFLSASARNGQFSVARTKDAFSLFISCKQDDILGSISAAVAEAERARQHGFTEAELQRAKKLYVSSAESDLAEAGDRKNGSFVRQCLNHFLEGEPITTPDYDLQFARKLAAEVTLVELNKAVKEMITDCNQVSILYAPEKISVPSKETIEKTILDTQNMQFTAYQEKKLPETLISKLPKAGKIVSEKPYQHGFTEFVLSNGMKVYFRQTDFESDGVQMLMKGEGGTSLYPDTDIPNFSLITSGVMEAGVGQFDAISLDKMLTGKIANARPYVQERVQGIRGNSSVKDIKTMFELTYLYFTQPRQDADAFKSLINRTHSFLANRNASPRVDYNDSIMRIVYGDHPRHQPVTQDVVSKADYSRILQIYKERFSDASNFNTVIIGNVSLDDIKPLICQYLASLPSTHKNEKINWQNVATVVGGESVHKFTKKQATPLANVSIYYTADIPFSAQADLELDMLTRVLQIAYTDSVREEKGGTYGVRVSANFEKDDHPTALLQISYNADPNRYDELNPIVYEQLSLIAERGPLASSMDKVKKYLTKQYNQMIITNGYWDYIIWHQIEDGVDFDKDYCKMVENTTSKQIQRMAQQILAAKRCIEITMLSSKE